MSQKQRKKDIAALGLAQGQSVQAVSELVGVSPRTLHRWLSRAEFKRQIDERQNELFATAVAKLTNLCGMAVDTLEGLLATGADAVKIRAVGLVLENVCRLKEVKEFGERLSRIEENLNASKNQKTVSGPGIPHGIGNGPRRRLTGPGAPGGQAQGAGSDGDPVGEGGTDQ